MFGRAALALALSAAWTGPARVDWPGSLEVDGRALAGVPESERADAVARFVARNGVSAAAPWLRPLLNSGPPAVRLLAARLLVREGDPIGRGAALAWLTGPSATAGDRALGLDALSYAGAVGPEVRAAFEQAARDRDAQMRAEALDAIGRIDAAQPDRASPSLPVILGCLDDLDREVRVRAVRLVARAAESEPSAAAAPMLLDRLDDPDRLIRVTAIRALGALRDPRVVPALLRLAQADPPDLQIPAVDALGWPGAEPAVPFLTSLLRRRPADEAAAHAARALGQIAVPKAVAALVGALHLPPVSEEVGAALVDAGASAVGPLLRELDGPDLPAAARAIALLSAIDDPRSGPALARAARRAAGAGPLALVAVQALGRVRDAGAFAPLAEATESALPEVRRAALDALSRRADARAAGLVDHGLADPDPTVRAAAARLAARLAVQTVLTEPAVALADRLSDDALEVRVEAARALGAIRPPAAPARHDLLARALAALSHRRSATPDPGESDAIADALEALAEDATDAARLDAALRGGVAVRLLGPALRRAHAQDRIDDQAIVTSLLYDLSGETATALAAADALAAARLSDSEAARLARGADDAEPAVRARLCAAVARLSDGGAWLSAWMAPGQPPEVRAAAAWAARSRPELAARLRELSAAADWAVAANARAALADGHGAAPTGARLVDAGGRPAAGRWVTVTAGGLSVAARSAGRGELRVDGLPAGPLSIHPAP